MWLTYWRAILPEICKSINHPNHNGLRIMQASAQNRLHSQEKLHQEIWQDAGFDLYFFRLALLLRAELLVLSSQSSVKLNTTKLLHKSHERANMVNALVDDWYPGKVTNLKRTHNYSRLLYESVPGMLFKKLCIN